MIIGIGIDIVEIERIAAIVKRQPNFVARILTEQERSVSQPVAERRAAEYLAGRFAAKEAMAKAIGTGIGKSLGFQDMEVWKDEYGKPYIRLSKEAAGRLFADPSKLRIHLSISHSKEYAVAQVIIEE
ncbi:holo-ACP synthase [Brevibacillus migulae]|uniref:holo-ACP synthase n=1 Tax=Brevibacillus migulae TaxID=1644114 RepID=UPI00106E0399|nr:holo-ACP synthase [Brevibacillus migulae]